MLRLRTLPLLLALAAFSECGPRPAGVILHGPALVSSTVLPDGTLRCDPARLEGRMSGTGEGTAIEWTETWIQTTDAVDNGIIATREEDAAWTAALWGAARLERGEIRSMELTMEVPRPASVLVHFEYRVVGEGLIGSRAMGTAWHSYRCFPPAAG